MALSEQDISKIANLARLDLPADEGAKLQGQINAFFKIVEKMQAVDTTGITPLAHPVEVIQSVALRLRDDAVSEPSTAANRDYNQRSAPVVERGLFLVPKVIE